MNYLRICALTLVFLATLSLALGVTVQELAQRFQDLPTVAEKDLPPLKNKREPFPGLVKHKGLSAHTWVRFPFVENPASIGFDPKGRLFVSEANRFWLGVPDLRGANELVRGDFQSITVQDRQKLYDAHPGRFPEGFFTRVADRIIRLEDRDGNGAADHRTLFSDRFREPLDGIGFSVLAEDDAVYFTCIPNLWKMKDGNDDGVADSHEAIVKGFGVRVSFIGHDLHGITRGPDGRLYFSVGDRGYHVTTEDGRVYSAPGRGAIFRCESDGSGFELYCTGLRNPQELAFDEYGNLFTFDNTGDIGDLARMVYALEGSDSGWDMAHQSAHHYRTILDWQSFHPPRSMWVEEKMFDTFNEEQPQWVYPPAAHVARGPSGVTWLTGESIPEDLRGKFLLANYRGPSVNCTVLTIGVKPQGAGYTAASEEVLVEGVGVTDVELGYDGNIYLCDFGGGWSVNTNGAIQVLTSNDKSQQAAGAEVKTWFHKGLNEETIDQLVSLLTSPDKRLRQLAQFELVKRGEEGREVLAKVARDSSLEIKTRLHGIWGLGQLGRSNQTAGDSLLVLVGDSEPEIRANAARTIGSVRDSRGRSPLLELLKDPSPRVRSLAAIALGRVSPKGDKEVIAALYQAAADMKTVDPVLRHACLSALDKIGTVDSAVERAGAEKREMRLMALLFLRRHQSKELARFLSDEDALIRREAVRAIYDTAAMDGPAGAALAGMAGSQDPGMAEFPPAVQRRVIAANYRSGTEDSGRALLQMAADPSLDAANREAALHALRLWESHIDTDPVLGHFRPQVNKDRSMEQLGKAIGPELKRFLAENPPANLAALAMKLADESGVRMSEETLRKQIANAELDAGVRVAALDSLVGLVGKEAGTLILSLQKDAPPELGAAAIRHGFALEMEETVDAARKALISGSLASARAGIAGLVAKFPEEGMQLWNNRDQSGFRQELWLDLYLALQNSENAEAKQVAAAHAASAPHAVAQLGSLGGDAARGEAVFRNQGACLQCHKIGSDGGIQGPPLTRVAERLKPDKLVESLVDPNAEIAENYGLSTIKKKDGSTLVGRVAERTKEMIRVVGIDGKETEIELSEVEEETPPVSAMPPLGLSLSPLDLRDLVAYLSSRTAAVADKEDSASHGEGEEEEKAKIAK